MFVFLPEVFMVDLHMGEGLIDFTYWVTNGCDFSILNDSVYVEGGHLL